MRKFYSYNRRDSNFVGYVDLSYLSNPQKGRSHSSYAFLSGNISWHSIKHTLVATSSNHAEILAFYEASRECVMLKSLIQYVRSSCQLPSIAGISNIINEDKEAFIK